MFIIVVATPVEVLGCKLRELLAIALVMTGGLLGLAAVIKGLADKIRNRPAVYIVSFES